MNNTTKEVHVQRLKDAHVHEKLREMERNPLFNTRISSYSANVELYPDGQIPFVDKHIAYLMDHPGVNPDQYLSNLRLMFKKRN